MTDTAASAGQSVYGLIALGDVAAALAIAEIKEVVACPDHFESLPVAVDGLLGAMDLRGLVLPVLDLRPRLGIAVTTSDDQVVIVLTNGRRLLGVIADRLRNVIHVPSTQLVPLKSEGEDLFVCATFQHEKRIVSILDTARILSLRGVPTVADSEPLGELNSAAHSGSTDRWAATNARPAVYTILRCGTYTLAIDVAHVHTTLGSVSITPSVMDSSLCLGTTEYVGLRVPVVDPLALLGLGSSGTDFSGPGLVIEIAAGFIVLAVSALLDLAEIPAAAVMAVQGGTFSAPHLLVGVSATSAAGHTLLVNGAALRADTQLHTLAAMNTKVDDSKGSIDPKDEPIGTTSSGPQQLIFSLSAGQSLVATPIEQVSEILPMPAILTQTHADPRMLGVMTHRNVVVPIYCLSSILGQTSTEPATHSCVLLLRTAGYPIGFAVRGLSKIAKLTWQEEVAPRRAVPEITHVGHLLERSPLVHVADTSGLLPHLSLETIAELLNSTENAEFGSAPVPLATSSLAAA